ncbi:hypothetical protein ACGFNU_20945 [Spirillospora sp. NPDC048911]|uniref:hypothetical protein n=1 Tax=Spirillospora sp. NPDC048911 TaxID=3364527 RepID=UPI003720FF7B
MTTATKTRCEVDDQIVEWTSPDRDLQIHEGDLILDNGKFALVKNLELIVGKSKVRYVLAPGGLRMADAADLVAVRRYTETSESSSFATARLSPQSDLVSTRVEVTDPGKYCLAIARCDSEIIADLRPYNDRHNAFKE